MKSSVVLLSGGLDSTVNFYWAAQETQIKLALTFDYGQRAAKREVEAARRLSQEKGVPHKVLCLPWFSDFTQTSLVNRDSAVPVKEQVQVADLAVSKQTARSVWVPNRNGVFLNIAAAYAEGLEADEVVPGFNLEEAATFADNSQNFIDALNRSLFLSTRSQVKVQCWTTSLDKREIVKKGKDLGVPFDLIWPCYFDGPEICRECESCQRYLRAIL